MLHCTGVCPWFVVFSCVSHYLALYCHWYDALDLLSLPVRQAAANDLQVCSADEFDAGACRCIFVCAILLFHQDCRLVVKLLF